MKRLSTIQSESLWGQLLPTASRHSHTLQDALRMGLLQAILSGQLPSRTKLPSTRELAALLNVARITVSLTYERLAAEGFLEPRERLGYFVASKLPKQGPLRTEAKAERETPPDWSTRLPKDVPSAKWLEKPRDWQSYPYPFVYGQLDPKLFPHVEWRECSRLAQSATDSSRWAADAIDMDDPMLIAEIINGILTKRSTPQTVKLSLEGLLFTTLGSSKNGHLNPLFKATSWSGGQHLDESFESGM